MTTHRHDLRPGRTDGHRGARRGVIAALVLAGAIVAAPVTAATASALHRSPGDGSMTDVRPARSDRIEALTLRCGPREDVVAIACRWREPQHPDAAALALIRTSPGDDSRNVIVRTDDLSQTAALDDSVRTGVRYAYRVITLDASGRLVGMSRRTVAGIAIEEPPPAVEVLRLECAARDDLQVGCRWTLPSSERVRSISLWRSVDGGPRELVESFGAPFATSYVDTVPDGASRVVYAVLGENADGRIVARSRPDAVSFVAPPPTPTRPVVEPVDVERPMPTVVEAPEEPSPLPEPDREVDGERDRDAERDHDGATAGDRERPATVPVPEPRSTPVTATPVTATPATTTPATATPVTGTPVVTESGEARPGTDRDAAPDRTDHRGGLER